MPYIHVVTVGLKEVGRALSMQDAAELMVSRCQKLIDDGASPSVQGGCWIEVFLVMEEETANAALRPEYNLHVHRWVGVDQYDDVIANAHKQGWMQDGKWVTQAVV